MAIGLVKVPKNRAAKQTHTCTFLGQEFPTPILFNNTFFFSYKNEHMENSLGIAVLSLRVTPIEAGPFVWGLEDFSSP